MNFILLQFSSVAQLCPTLCDPMGYSLSGFPVLQCIPDSLKPMAIESMMSSNHLVLCCPGLHTLTIILVNTKVLVILSGKS